MTSIIAEFLAAAIPVIVAITLHEAAHGYAAWALGDDTAKSMGRLSLNPLRHVDRVGTILLPGFLLLSQLATLGHVAFMFGWAKPVPVSPWRFRDPRRGMMLVAAAGPAMNFFLAWLGALTLHLIPLLASTPHAAEMQLEFVTVFIVANLALGLFNLIPIPPLDGGRIAVGLLPEPAARAWAKLERAGILMILLVLFLLPVALQQMGIQYDPVRQYLTVAILHVSRWVLWLAGSSPFLPFIFGDGSNIYSPVAADALVLRLDGFEGPLDLLLELARGQKVDLARISILALVDQYLAVIEGARKVRLELAADWLVMAAWLTWLKSRLLVPATGDLAEEGEEAADVLAARLRELQTMRAAAQWFGARPVLGQDVFSRGVPEDLSVIDRSRLALDLSGLMRAYLAALRRGAGTKPYRPPTVSLWSVQEALTRLAALVGSLPDWSTLDQYLPERLGTALERRGALASTLLAGLEMARGGAVRLRQEAAFGPIHVQGGHVRRGGEDA